MYPPNPMIKTFPTLIATCVLITAVNSALPGTAGADVAQQMAVELQAAGLPSPSVTLETPPPATASDLAAFEADPEATAPSVLIENLLSPDPTSPLPVAKVRYGSTSATPFPGYVAPPNESAWPAIEDADDPLWRLQIMSALKHVLSGGATVAGVSMQPQFPNRDLGRPDYWATPPDPADLPPASLGATLPRDATETQLRAGIPAEARLAELDVIDWVAGERRVIANLELPWLEFGMLGAQGLISYLLDEQLALNGQGAAIGSVVVRVRDSITGNTLMTFAGDATWGQHFAAYAPPVMAFTGRQEPGLTSDPQGDVEQVVAGAQETPDPSALP